MSILPVSGKVKEPKIDSKHQKTVVYSDSFADGPQLGTNRLGPGNAVTGQVPHSTACDFQKKDTAVLGEDLGKNLLTPRTA
jgi:hypothetical protein